MAVAVTAARRFGFTPKRVCCGNAIKRRARRKSAEKSHDRPREVAVASLPNKKPREGITIMSKARWLLSAGVFVFAAPAFAQPTQDTVPTQESPTEEGAVDQEEGELREGDVQDDGVIVVTAQGRA